MSTIKSTRYKNLLEDKQPINVREGYTKVITVVQKMRKKITLICIIINSLNELIIVKIIYQ